MDADVEQNDYDVFRRDVYKVAVSNEFESQENRRIVRSIDEDDDDEDFDDLEALRLAALRSLGTKNSFGKQGLTAAELGSTRRVSLGRKDKSDLQVVSLERQESFSSTSTDYEEIDLSERTPPDSEANDSGSDIDDAESDKKIEIESPRDTQEMESKEDSDEGHDIDDNDDDEKNDIVTDEENNSVWSDNEDFGNTVVLTDEGGIENNISTDEDDTENNLDLSDEDSEEDIQENSQNYLEALEALEDELNDSSNAINVLNDISITIANESLASHSPTNLGEHLEIVDDEYEDNTGLNQEIESDNESINELQMTSTQRIVVSQSDSENESDGKVEDKTEMTKENHCASESEMIVDQPVLGNHNLKEKKESVVSPAIISSEKVNTEVLVLKDRSKNNLKAENKKPTDLVAKPSPKVVKNTSSKLPSAEKTGLVTLPNLKKDKPQELLSKENTVGKSKEAKESRKVTETAHKGNEKVSSKAADRESKVEIPANKESKLSTEPKLKSDESEERMDFDQLSIEDEDSDFEEEEENQPAVKSKIGLNKIPTESKMRKRSFSSENDRTKQHSRSPERYRASSRSYRDRQRDQHLRDRSRERFSKRRSLSPSTDRRHRGSDSRYRRSRSRDRKQNRISSAKGRDRDRESRHFRSRSRSNSRNTTNRTEKVVKTNVDRPVKKESIRSSVQEHLELKKNLNARPLSTSPRKEIKTRDSGTEEKTARTKHAKSLSIETKVANGAKAVSKPKIQRDVDGVIIKQPKDLRSRLLEKKGDQNEVDIKNLSTVVKSKKPVKKQELTRIQGAKPQKETVMLRVKQYAEKKSTAQESTSHVKERELDERIQRIKQKNEAILKRAKEIEAEKMKFHS